MRAFVENLRKRFAGIDYQAIHDETVLRMQKERGNGKTT
jgi:hypothetical protein